MGGYLNNPPKPHAFLSLPLQSRLDLNLKSSLSKILNITLEISLLISLSFIVKNKAFSLFEYCDAPRPWGIYLPDSATPQMQGLVELHDKILFYFVIILFAVGWIFFLIIINYIKDKSFISHKYLNHGTLIELIWTITPALILILIAFPSFKLLYLMDEVSDPAMSVLAEGHQWYWSYQYPDFLNSDEEFIEFDSYLVPESDLETDTNKTNPSWIKRFLTFDYFHYPSQFDTVHSFKADLKCIDHSLINKMIKDKEIRDNVRYIHDSLIDEDYEDGSWTDGNSDLDEGRALIDDQDLVNLEGE